MTNSSGYNIRAAFSKFFIETLSEKQNDFQRITEANSTVYSAEKLNIASGVAIHFKQNLIVGLTLYGEEYSADPIFFEEGFECIFTPILENEKEIHPVKLISLLKKQEEIQVICLLLDVPISKVFLSFLEPTNQEDSGITKIEGSL